MIEYGVPNRKQESHDYSPLRRALIIRSIPDLIEKLESRNFLTWAEHYFSASPERDNILSLLKSSSSGKKWMGIHGAAIRDLKYAKQRRDRLDILSMSLQGERFLRMALQIIPQSILGKEYYVGEGWYNE
jgi:hypothetical protein